VCIIFAGTNGYLDDVPVREVGKFESALLSFLRGQRKDILEWIESEDPKIKGEPADKLKAALDEFAATYA